MTSYKIWYEVILWNFIEYELYIFHENEGYLHQQNGITATKIRKDAI